MPELRKSLSLWVIGWSRPLETTKLRSVVLKKVGPIDFSGLKRV